MQKGILTKAKDVLPNCDYIVDLSDLRIIWANNNLVSVIGYPKEKALKMKTYDFLPRGYSRQEHLAKIAERVATKSGFDNIILEGADGHKHIVRIAYQLFSYKGKGYLANSFVERKIAS